MPNSPADAPEAETLAEQLLDALEAAIPAMASRATNIASAFFAEATEWDDLERRRFEHQAAERIEAILTVTRSSDAARDVVLVGLVEAGGGAAAAGAPLPQLLLALRVSRDLIVQTAVRAAGARGPDWSPALAIVLTKVLPVSDRLTDAVARGYWLEVVRRSQIPPEVPQVEH